MTTTGRPADPEMVPMSARPTYYLAQHPHSGPALFTRLDKAKKWCDEQHDYHHTPDTDTPDTTVRWVDGGHHGWHAQRWVSADARTKHGTTALATVTELRLDGKLSDWVSDSWA